MMRKVAPILKPIAVLTISTIVATATGVVNSSSYRKQLKRVMSLRLYQVFRKIRQTQQVQPHILLFLQVVQMRITTKKIAAQKIRRQMILTVEAVRIQVQPLRQAAQHQVRLYKTTEMRQQKMLR